LSSSQEADVMSTDTNPASIATLVFLALTASITPVLAQERAVSTGAAEVNVQVGSRDSRIRCLDREARRIVERAVAGSPTVARMFADLEKSDLIVGIQLCPLPKPLLGEARIVMATPDVRYVRIRIKIPDSTDALISVLGHELQHALELAAARDVRTAEAQAELFRRIGYERHSGGYFETPAALDASRAVAAEIAHAPVK
jgi:hypothetical protein